MKMMMLSFPLGWSSMFTIGGTSKESVIAFYESLTPLKGVLPSKYSGRSYPRSATL